MLTRPALGFLAIVLAGFLSRPSGGEEKAAAWPAWVTAQWRAEQAFLAADIAAKRASHAGPSPCVYHPQATIFPEDRDPADIVLRRTRALLREIQGFSDAPDMGALDGELNALEKEGRGAETEPQAREQLFLRVCDLRRRIAFANPVLRFDEMVFMNAAAPIDTHISAVGPIPSPYMAFSTISQNLLPSFLRGRIGYDTDDVLYPPVPGQGFEDYFSPRFRSRLYAQAPAARKETALPGLVVLSDFKGPQPKLRAALQGAKVQTGRTAGVALSEGLFSQDWDLDYDGRRAVFCWIHQRTPNLYAANLDGSNLAQLTDTVWANMGPAWLPSGRIVFRSNRRFVIDRCQPWDHENYSYRHCSSLFSMKADGSDVVPLSWHETNEVYPSVDNDGRLIYTRWDYIDRGFNAAQHIWNSFPDGRDARALHGNYMRPYFQGERVARDTPGLRPCGEFQAQALPGTQGKYVLIDGGHHAAVPGSPFIVDLNVPDDGNGSQLWRLLDVDLCGDGQRSRGLVSPWPLSDSFFLIAMQARAWGAKAETFPAGEPGVYLLDKFGNLEVLIAAGAARLNSCWGPRPLAPRPRPPVIPEATWQGERRDKEGHARATIALMNVYDADFTWPEGRKPTELRVVQCWGRPWSRPGGHYPTLGYALGAVARMALGRVPIEADGSAYFEAPVECEIYFQALDENGMAIQSMRSGTYVHPGEQLSCAGCHEDKWRPRRSNVKPLALRRPPSKLQPEVGGPYPQTFARLVQPLLESKCLPCHQREGKGLRDMNYWALRKLAYCYENGGLATGNPFYRSTPGRFGAFASGLGQALLKSHQARVTPEEIRRVSLWLDLNSQNLSDYTFEDEQVRGRIVWPWIDGDAANPQHTERGRPLPERVLPPDGLPGALRLMSGSDWQQRQWGYEALREARAAARSEGPALRAVLTKALDSDRIEEAEPILRAFREADEALFAWGADEVAGIVRGPDAKKAFRACEALKFCGCATPAALEAFGRALSAPDYDLASSAAEALAALGPRAAPAAPALLKGLESPHDRVVELAAKVLGQVAPPPPGLVPALTKVLQTRSQDFTFLGKPGAELRKVPRVVEEHAFLTQTVYRNNPENWGDRGRQDPFEMAACALERGRDRKMIAMCARTLGGLGAAAQDSLPALAHCAALDAADQPVLVESAVRIAPLGALAACGSLLARCKDDPDRTARLVHLAGLIGEHGGAAARGKAIEVLGAVQSTPPVVEEAARWKTVLGGGAPAAPKKK